MSMRDVDVFISGGGIAGLVAAAAFETLGYTVALADPAPPPESAEAAGSDLRSTAFLAPARALLDRAGLWTDLAAHATPLDVLRVIDCTGTPPAIRTDRAFRSTDLDQPSFGWNLPNWLTRQRLVDHLAQRDAVRLMLGAGFSGILTRDREALVTLTTGDRLRARLAIAADGRASPLRDAAGIGVRVTRYGQKALAFAVTHPVPHENVSTELYLSGGAFTLVPLPDVGGQPASAVVWMNDGPEAVRLAALDPDAFGRAATERSCEVLGPLSLASLVRTWPIVTQQADRLAAQRVAVIAEAAHVLPPIGAQGLNTSLQDVATLVDLAAAAPAAVGTPGYLDAFEAARLKDIRVKSRAIDLYNRVCRSDEPPVQALRSLGLRLVHDIAPIRRNAMRAGLGPMPTA